MVVVCKGNLFYSRSRNLSLVLSLSLSIGFCVCIWMCENKSREGSVRVMFITRGSCQPRSPCLDLQTMWGKLSHVRRTSPISAIHFFLTYSCMYMNFKICMSQINHHEWHHILSYTKYITRTHILIHIEPCLSLPCLGFRATL